MDVWFGEMGMFVALDEATFSGSVKQCEPIDSTMRPGSNAVIIGTILTLLCGT